MTDQDVEPEFKQLFIDDALAKLNKMGEQLLELEGNSNSTALLTRWFGSRCPMTRERRTPTWPKASSLDWQQEPRPAQDRRPRRSRLPRIDPRPRLE